MPFRLDQWIDLAASDGPVTLHRIRVARQGAGAKSKFLRPGNSEYLEDVQVQLEFSNDATRDWEARLDIEWLDADGAAIDGYNDKEIARQRVAPRRADGDAVDPALRPRARQDAQDPHRVRTRLKTVESAAPRRRGARKDRERR